MTLQLLQPFDLADQPTIVWNTAAYPTARVTLTADRDFGAPVPLEAGSTFILYVLQDSTGGWTVTWDAVFKWPAGSPPTLTATADAIDIIAFVTDGEFMYGVPQYDFR